MNKDKILAILETAVDKNGNIPMRIVRQAFEKLPELCDDAVSRREAIDAIGEVHPLDYNAQAIKSRIEKLPSVQPEQRWISCSERLPEDDVEVLITDDSGGVQWLAIDKMLSYEDESGRFWIYSQNPTAWMPLPESYRAERRTDE